MCVQEVEEEEEEEEGGGGGGGGGEQFMQYQNPNVLRHFTYYIKIATA